MTRDLADASDAVRMIRPITGHRRQWQSAWGFDMLRLRTLCCFTVALLIAVAASATHAQRAPDVTRTDSAGITIATNTAPASSLPLIVTAPPEPRLRIGAVDGAPEILFNRIRGVVRLGDGGIAVTNGQPPEIRVFSSTGAFVTKLGRRGQGPGEFQSVASVIAAGGDTILATNVPRFDLLRFTRAGYIGMTTFSRDSVDARLPRLRIAEGIQEYFRNGSFVIAVAPDTNIPEEVRYPTGKLFRPTTTAVWFSRDYGRSRVIGPVGGIQQMFVDLGNGRRTAVIPPNASTTTRALGGRGTRLCISAGDGPEVRCVDADGSRLIVRWTQPSVPTDPRAVEEWKAQTRAGQTTASGATPQITERIISQVIIPPTEPATGRILVDADRRIFVSTPDLNPTTDGPVRHRVFSATGELLGVAALPRIAIYDLGADYLMGVARDADGVEFVVLHDVRWTPR